MLGTRLSRYAAVVSGAPSPWGLTGGQNGVLRWPLEARSPRQQICADDVPSLRPLAPPSLCLHL